MSLKGLIAFAVGLLACLAMSSSVLAVNVTGPIIDEVTGGDWDAQYGDCFYLIPSPERPEIEERVGPNWFFLEDAKNQYKFHNCYGGDLFSDSSANTHIDWRIFRDFPGYSSTARAWHTLNARTGSEQWNPCRGEYYHATWDSHAKDAAQLVELNITAAGPLTVAYYFTYAQHNCRQQEYTFTIDVDGDGIIDPEDYQSTGIINDFSHGVYVVFQIDDFNPPPTGSILTMESHVVDLPPWTCTPSDDPDDPYPWPYPNPNAVISGVYVNGTSVCNETAGLGDFVWEDLNADGIQDDNEPGIPDVTVKLLDPGPDGECDTGDENVLDTTFTDADGLYQFTGLVPDRYCVEFDITTVTICDPDLGFPAFSPQNQGGDDAKDSDADPATGQTGNIDLDPGEYDPTNDAGVYCPAGLGDYVWFDVNGEGTQPGDPPAEGATVELYDCADNMLATTTTDANGFYQFVGLMPGNYYVKFYPLAGYVFTQQYAGADPTIDSNADQITGESECVTLASNEYNPTIDAGLIESGQQERPEIMIEKATNTVDADDPNAGDAPQIAPGDPVTWTYVVSNTGTVDLINVQVNDDQIGPVTCPQTTLAVDESMECTANGTAEDLLDTTYTTVPGLCGQYPQTPLYENKGKATGESEAGDFVEDEDPSHYCNEPDPEIDIEKATNGVDADDPNAGDAPQVSPGDPVTWTYVVTNTGNVDLINVTVVDDQGAQVSCPQTTLAVGESMECTATGTAEDLENTQNTTVPGLCGSYPQTPLYENYGSVTGESEAGDFVEDDDPSHYCNPQVQFGTGTPGYWKNHPDAWPVDAITIGGVTYSKDEAIEILKLKLKDNKDDSDKTITMFQALVAAKLNVLIGTDASCIADTILAADEWMATYGPVGSDVDASTQAWKEGEPLYWELDDYNNGRLCAPSRDFMPCHWDDNNMTKQEFNQLIN